MDVTKTMLKRTHYRWGDTGAVWAHHEWEGTFEREKGEHIVAVLQKAANALRLSEPSHVHTLEDLISTELPSGAFSRHDAVLWLSVEYKKRSYRARPA